MNLWWQRIKVTNCIIKVSIIRGNITWRSLALRGWAHKQKAQGNLCFPLRRAYLLLLCIYFYIKSKFFSPFLFIFLLWQASCGEERSRYICPVEYVGRRNNKPLSFYVSGWNVLLMCTRWVLAIIEEYMMVEYVDLPKGSGTWPFLKRW